MSTLRVVKKTTMIFLCFGFANSLLALPKYERTTLPFPKSFLESEQEMAKEVLKLQVYQDSKNSKQYYYVPPMHLRQYTSGAAGLMINTVQIRHYADARKALQMRDNYAKEHSAKRLMALEQDVEKYKKDVDEAERKLSTALESGNQQLIGFLQQRFAAKHDLYEKSLEKLNKAKLILDNGKDLITIPAEIRKTYERQAIHHLAVAGFDISSAVAEDPIEAETKINEAMHAVENYYGGFMSVNAYGGFTEAQLTALRAFKAKYNPGLTISLLPIDSLSFFSLTELQANTKNDTTGHKMFSQIKGSGDFLGANITLDASISGGLGLAEHLAPFILPIGIKVTFKQQVIPTKAELNCKFENGFSVEGRADARDGLVIFDNDVTVNLSSTDKNKTACHLDVQSGDVDAAQIKSLQMLEEHLSLMGLHRTNLTKAEKENYYKNVLEDVQNNRRNNNSNIGAAVVAFVSSGWGGAVVAAVSEITDFHWHTNIQNVHNFSNLDFNRKISIAGHTTVEKALPTNLCLVYNKNVNAYDRCTETELNEALSMRQSINNADNSPECQNAENPIDCGHKRDAVAKNPPKRTNIGNDATIVDQI